MMKKRRKPGTQYCCVVGCNNNLRNSSHSLKFYRFPGKPYEALRRQAWITAVRRQKEDGSDWVPSQSARICSAHFVGNCRKESEAHPSYVPTIFPAVYGRKKAPNTGKAQKMLKSTGQGRPQPPLLEAPQPISDWDPLQMLVDVATEAASFKRTSTVGTQCNRVPLRLLSSASGGRDGSTQVACAEQVDAGTSTEDDWLRQTGVLGLESPRDAKHILQECSVVTTAFGLSPSPTPGTRYRESAVTTEDKLTASLMKLRMKSVY